MFYGDRVEKGCQVFSSRGPVIYTDMMSLTRVFLAVILSSALLCFIEPTSGAEFCEDKADGNYKDPDNCYGFITCANQITYFRSCPEGLMYNEKTDQCDYPENVQCSTEVIG
ncbi:hypothetical protein OS493_007844 [Desmophyllum pertusum]|uniref:Chitin-binding type-2 domain-containing protein n=1 Tax=Desmophyllum pertusum TaxID=174260 RepID=A0A9W9YS41_9CNID|nr:hypothetical protein OS493_007844 [Desmophyllum pertusum]